MGRRAAVLCVLLCLAPIGVSAQLISPGRLAEPHAKLEGVRACTQCHELGRRGAADTRCLQCHEPVRTRVQAGRGYHATAREPCASCHKEHFGRDFALIRFDTAAFDHAAVGFALTGTHAKTRCAACHADSNVMDAGVRAWAERQGVGLDGTLLGLSTECHSCHSAENPHGAQFGDRTCESCHDAGRWDRATRFDHDRTRYALTGRHREARCDGCHRPTAPGRIVYSGLDARTCGTCHEDAHAGAMGGGCEGCHRTIGWAAVERTAVERRFDHATTGFVLEGAHEAAGCAACHGRSPHGGPWLAIRYSPATASRSYPRPVTEGGCVACHTAYHATAIETTDSRDCTSCHTQHTWSPGLFDLDRHLRVDAFPLTGAHQAVPCVRCHTRGEAGRTELHPPAECATCHRADDPHDGRFGTSADCGSCHETAAWASSRMDHSQLRAGSSCASCHAEHDPHGGQFEGRACDACHGTATFRIESFPHDSTVFPLEGAHEKLECQACHAPQPTRDGESSVRYRPLPVRCSGCHAGEPP